MSLIDFLKEEREERKKRRKLQKEAKKKKLTKEQKKYRIFGIITGFLIAFGAIFSCCYSPGGDFSWTDILGITDEMIVELEKTVDEKTIMPNGRIGEKEWNSCNQKLKNIGIDFDDMSETNMQATSSFALTDREAGALAKQLLESINNDLKVKVLDLQIYAVGEVFYEKSITHVDLSKIIVNATLPSVYVITTSKVEILGNSIVCMNYDIKLNNIDSDMGNEILELISKNSTTDIKTLSNTLINTALDMFVQSAHVEVYLSHGQINFRV